MPFRRSKLNHRHRDGHVLVWEQNNHRDQPKSKPIEMLRYMSE